VKPSLDSGGVCRIARQAPARGQGGHSLGCGSANVGPHAEAAIGTSQTLLLSQCDIGSLPDRVVRTY
jgi:hypothetical protein